MSSEEGSDHARETDNDRDSGRDVPFPVVRDRSGDGEKEHRRQRCADGLVNLQTKDRRQERNKHTRAAGADEAENDADAEGRKRKYENESHGVLFVR